MGLHLEARRSCRSVTRGIGPVEAEKLMEAQGDRGIDYLPVTEWGPMGAHNLVLE